MKVKFRCGCVDSNNYELCPKHKEAQLFIRHHKYRTGFISCYHRIKGSRKIFPFYVALHSCTYDKHGFIETISAEALTKPVLIDDSPKEQWAIYHMLVTAIIPSDIDPEKDLYAHWLLDIGTIFDTLPERMLV